MQTYVLKNGETILIREPRVEDAKAIIDLIKQADTETNFLARNSGEFTVSIEKEKSIITSMLESDQKQWYLVEYDGKIVGQASVGVIRGYRRYLHRGEVALVVLKEYCDLGIGGKLMLECIKWAKENNLEKLELEVVANNQRALSMYQGFGFQIVGTIIHALKYDDGSYADEYAMELFF